MHVIDLHTGIHYDSPFNHEGFENLYTGTKNDTLEDLYNYNHAYD